MREMTVSACIQINMIAPADVLIIDSGKWGSGWGTRSETKIQEKILK